MVRLKEQKTATFKNTLRTDAGERSVVAKISTSAVDRDGDVLIPSGIDTSDFRKNPVVMFAHNSTATPVGTASKIQKSSDAIRAKMTFTERPPNHPAGLEWLPDTLLYLFQKGVLRAFSVGFLPIETRRADQKDKDRFGDEAEFIISKWKLLEFSIVPIPANQEALAESVSKGLDIGGYIPREWDITTKRVLKIEVPRRRVLSLD